MKSMIATLLLCIAPGLTLAQDPVVPVGAGQYDERTFNVASELVAWCRQEAEARVIGQGQTPYQWAASHKSVGRVLHVDGSLRVEGSRLTVSCRVAQGARERYASIEIEPEAS